jgi:hypothetical protein
MICSLIDSVEQINYESNRSYECQLCPVPIIANQPTNRQGRKSTSYDYDNSSPIEGLQPIHFGGWRMNTWCSARIRVSLAIEGLPALWAEGISRKAQFSRTRA